MKPFSIDHYLGKELVLDLTGSPEELTYVGILDRFNWLTNHNSKSVSYTHLTLPTTPYV